MSQSQKLVDRIRSKPKDFTWTEAKRLLKSFGYTVQNSSGSRRKFIHSENGRSIALHEPHPGEILKAYQVELILEHLEQEGLL